MYIYKSLKLIKMHLNFCRNMESTLKSALGLSVLKSKGSKGGGCISESKVFDTENGPIFVKVNDGDKVTLLKKQSLDIFNLC